MSSKNLAKLLKTDAPVKSLAELLRSHGRGRDTVLAHITPREARKLKAMGGSGTINPATGLPEFDDWGGIPMDFGTSSLPSEVTSPNFAGDTSYGGLSQPQDTFAQSPTFSQQAFEPSNVGFTDYNGASFGPSGQVNFNTAYGQGQPLSFAPTEAPAATVSPQLASVAPVPGADQPAGSGSDIVNINQVGGQPTDQPATAKPGGIQGILGNLGVKDLIAALGVGGMGLNYLKSQQQAGSAAQKLQNAYQTAALQSAQNASQQAAPYIQQGGTQLGQALTGAMSPAQMQQMQAAQAQAAQAVARSGGVGAAQQERSLEDLRQRLLAQQYQTAFALLGTGTPILSAGIQQAVNQQLQGTVAGINAGNTLSQQAGTAAGGMLQALAAIYARSPTQATG